VQRKWLLTSYTYGRNELTLEKIQKWNVSELPNYKWLFNIKLSIFFTQNHNILSYVLQIILSSEIFQDKFNKQNFYAYDYLNSVSMLVYWCLNNNGDIAIFKF